MPNQENTSSKAAPATAFSFDDSLAQMNITAREWLDYNQKSWDGLATAVIVFDSEGRMLLIQRASDDSMPNLWETPGGAVDDGDPSLLHAAARELWEEAGLVATRFTKLVSTAQVGDIPGFLFTNRTGTVVFCRFTFVVEVEDASVVRLDPKEHQDHVWVTEEEVTNEKVADRPIPVTNSQTKAHLLEGFRLRKQTLSQ